MSVQFTLNEMMSIAAARALSNNMTCFVGIGLPSEAANLARLSHAPDIVLIYESGTIQARPSVLPLSIGDGELCETAQTTVDVPEMFRYWLQGGHIDIGFLGTAQIDKFGNLNTTVIARNENDVSEHAYANPKVRLPGGGGAPEISTSAKQTIVMVKHSTRTFVEHVDFITSVGFGRDGKARQGNANIGRGPTCVITDLCILAPDMNNNELVVTHLHPGVSREKVISSTGWPIKFASAVSETPPPSDEELTILRQLKDISRA